MLSLSASDAQELALLTQALIRTPSLSGDEKAVADLLSDAMRHNGFTQVWRDRAGNVIGRYGSGEKRAILFDGHMDTVDVGERSAWTHNPFGGVIEGDILYGRGAVDMKSALAAMIYGVKLLSDAGAQLPGDLYVAFVVQEEPIEGVAIRSFLEESGLQPECVVLGEPTNLGVSLGQRGRVELQVSINGRSGHASAPSSGINAISAAARVIFGIDLLATQLLEDATLGQGSVAVTQITSSACSLNAIPDLCTVILDRRLTLGETEARAITEVQQIMRREGVRGDVVTLEYQTATYTGYIARGRKYFPPWLLPESDPLARRAIRTLERCLGIRPRIGLWSFSTDGAYTMGEAGIPTLGFGPGDERLAHTPEEQVRLTDVAQAAECYAQLAIESLKIAHHWTRSDTWLRHRSPGLRRCSSSRAPTPGTPS